MVIIPWRNLNTQLQLFIMVISLSIIKAEYTDMCLHVPAGACGCLRVTAGACGCLRVPARTVHKFQPMDFSRIISRQSAPTVLVVSVAALHTGVLISDI